MVSSEFGNLLYYARRYDAAEAACKKVLELDARFAPAHFFLRSIHAAQGRYAEAVDDGDRAFTLVHGDVLAPYLKELREAYRERGWVGYLRENLRMGLDEQGKPRGAAFGIAHVYALLGDKRQAVNWLEKAVDERTYHMAYLKVDPTFDPLRSEPRFQNLLQRIGLDPADPRTAAVH